MFPLKDNIPTDRFPVVTVTIIVINVLMFFLFQKARLALGASAIDECNVVAYGAIPYEITQGEQIQYQGAPCDTDTSPAITVFTSMFMHGGFLHIAGNMLFLWIFGNNVEDSMGRVRFVVFYLLGGLVALAAQVVVDTTSEVPTIGASGAVAGVLGGYILLHPRARVITVIFIIFFFTIVELPAMLVLGLWFVLQVVSGTLDSFNPAGEGGGVAYFAHIGGFVFGLVAIKLFADSRRRKDTPGPNRHPVY